MFTCQINPVQCQQKPLETDKSHDLSQNGKRRNTTIKNMYQKNRNSTASGVFNHNNKTVTEDNRHSTIMETVPDQTLLNLQQHQSLFNNQHIGQSARHLRFKSLNLEMLKNFEVKIQQDNNTQKKVVIIAPKQIETCKSGFSTARCSMSPSKEQKDFSSGIKNTYDFIKNKVLTQREILIQREEKKHESLATVVIKRDFKSREKKLPKHLLQSRSLQQTPIRRIIFAKHIIKQQYERTAGKTNQGSIKQREKIRYINSEVDFETMNLVDINLLSQEKGKFRRVCIESLEQRLQNQLNQEQDQNISPNKLDAYAMEQEKLRRMEVKRFKTIMERQKDSYDEFDNDDEIQRHLELLRQQNQKKSILDQQRANPSIALQPLSHRDEGNHNKHGDNHKRAMSSDQGKHKRAESGLVPDTRPLITKLFGDGMRFIRRKDLAVIYDKTALGQIQVL
ncbi:UNKNOWN [Stylonychia lemnae]|uniref:Uncharacterized protein n=1 Tax=Stylonychia lemnae TaxID=5949 RepID=A0A078AM06_STYLE|nr:UNKNOWN [Stylonychia lemnae]|eukprot:CDW82896.1 UNKNOWN [Stylonychia lemnae]